MNLSDKFEKMSIYDIDWKSLDNDGNEQVFTFKPLPFKFYPKTYDLLNKLQVFEGVTGLTDEEQNKRFLEKLDQSMIESLIELEKVMVQRSYPDLSEEKVELFVQSNTFQLLEPLLRLINRQEISNPRQAEAAQK